MTLCLPLLNILISFNAMIDIFTLLLQFLQMPWHCSCFLVLQAPQSQAVAKGVYINRQSMFYDLECSSSVFPRNRILQFLNIYVTNLSSPHFRVACIFFVFTWPCSLLNQQQMIDMLSFGSQSPVYLFYSKYVIHLVFCNYASFLPYIIRQRDIVWY